jgi:hypothetical protein
MKKIFCTVAVLFTGIAGFSQDVIITKTGEQIRAKITAVTDESITYKKYHDQEGATFTLKTDKIKIISWENGDVDDYEKLHTEVDIKSNGDTPKSEEVPPYIERQGKSFYLNNGIVYNEMEFKNFLTHNNLSPIWDKYENGRGLLSTGGVLIGIGLVLDVAGTVIFYRSTEPMLGIILCSIGGALEIAGIPTAIVGAVKRNRAINDYNTIYAGRPRFQYSQNITFKAGIMGNGIGFKINF